MSRADGNFDPIEAVRAFLEEARCDSQIKRTEATIFTVSDASAAVGAPEEEILKSILLRVNHGKSYALALMSGVNKVDTKKVKRALGASHVSRRRAARRLPGTAAHAARRGPLQLRHGMGRGGHRPCVLPRRARRAAAHNGRRKERRKESLAMGGQSWITQKPDAI